MRRVLVPLLVAGLCLPTTQGFTGLAPAAVQRAGVPVGSKNSNGNAAATRLRAGRPRCPKEQGRCRAPLMMVSKSGVLAEEARVDPYEIEAGLVEEDKAV